MTMTKEREVFNERDYFDDCLCEGVDSTGADWDAEIDRRLREVLDGEVELIPGEIVMQEMREVVAAIQCERDQGVRA